MAHKVLLFTLLAVAVAVEANVFAHHGVHHAPQPHSFGYSVKDKHGEQHRQETGNGHSGVKGSYGFTDARGVQRQVNYVADKAGFRAQVKTNEPGTANQDPAAVNVISSAHPYFGAGHGLGHGGYGGLGYAGYGGLGYTGYNGLYGGYGLGYNRNGYNGLGYGAYYGGYGYY